MGYAICRIEKVSSSHELASRYKHNYREYDVANANGKLSHLNREIKSLNGKTYEEIADEELIRMKLSGYSGRRTRKDAVKGLEVVLSYSQENKDDVPVEEWIKKNVEWLEEHFNPKDHEIHIRDNEGKVRTIESDNVKSIMVHLDEAVPHIHAFVVPIDEKGSLNAKSYMGNRQMLREYQDSYAEAMSEFGLKRGAQRMIVTHEDISKYHTALKEAVSAELPEIMPGEKTEDYRERANIEFQKEKIHHRNDVLKLKQEIKEARSERITTIVQHNMEKDVVGKQVEKLAKEMEVPELDFSTVKQIRRDVKQVNDFKKAVENYPDKEEAARIYDDFTRMINWQREQDKKKRRQKSEPERHIEESKNIQE